MNKIIFIIALMLSGCCSPQVKTQYLKIPDRILSPCVANDFEYTVEEKADIRKAYLRAETEIVNLYRVINACNNQIELIKIYEKEMVN